MNSDHHQTDPALADHFRQAMRSVASAVYLITSRGAEGDVGMTATAACSLSFDPMSVLICVNRSASIMRTLDASQRVDNRPGLSELLYCNGHFRRLGAQ